MCISTLLIESSYLSALCDYTLLIFYSTVILRGYPMYKLQLWCYAIQLTCLALLENLWALQAIVPSQELCGVGIMKLIILIFLNYLEKLKLLIL